AAGPPGATVRALGRAALAAWPPDAGPARAHHHRERLPARLAPGAPQALAADFLPRARGARPDRALAGGRADVRGARRGARGRGGTRRSAREGLWLRPAPDDRSPRETAVR